MSPSIFGPLRTWAGESRTIARWRERRYQLFVDLCRVRRDYRIVDVGRGGGAALERFNSTNPILALDLRTQGGEWLSRPNVTVMEADGTRLPFWDSEFDVDFSNSASSMFPLISNPTSRRRSGGWLSGTTSRHRTGTFRSSRTISFLSFSSCPNGSACPQPAVHAGMAAQGALGGDHPADRGRPAPALPGRNDPSGTVPGPDEESDGRTDVSELTHLVRAGIGSLAARTTETRDVRPRIALWIAAVDARRPGNEAEVEATGVAESG